MRYWQKGNRWNEEATEAKYARREGRWRWPDNGWRFISFHAIASTLFDYRDVPTENEMYFMGDFVRDIGLILDSAQMAIQKGVADKVAKREEVKRKLIELNRNEANTLSMSYSEDSATYVYLMEHVNGLIKIGSSKNPRARERTLQAEDPRLEMIFCEQAEAAMEKRFHEIFADLRVRGEWFRLDQHHIDWIKTFFQIKEYFKSIDDQQDNELESRQCIPPIS
jgi:hypothetical protein